MENKKTNKIYGILIVVMMAVLGLTVMLMSRAGLQTYKELRAELEVYSDSLKVIDTKFTTHSGAVIHNAAFKGKIVIAHFYDPNCENCDDKVWEELKRVQQEYKNKVTRRVQILSHSLSPDSLAQMNRILATHKIDTSNWKLVTTDSSTQMLQLLEKGYRIEAQKAKATLALLDINGYIVNYYDASKTEEVNQLMKHIAMIIPAKKDRRKLKYQPEQDLYNPEN